jgi:hypothetical protein
MKMNITLLEEQRKLPRSGAHIQNTLRVRIEKLEAERNAKARIWAEREEIHRSRQMLLLAEIETDREWLDCLRFEFLRLELMAAAPAMGRAE